MSQAIQFNGMNAVVDAYVSRGVPSFAIFAGKQFLIPVVTDDIEEGRSQLQTILEKFAEGGTNAIYTLKVYEDIFEGATVNKPAKIKENTPADGSFNFRLNDPAMTVYNYNEKRISGMNEIVSRLSAIENKLSAAPVAETAGVWDNILQLCDTEAGKIIAPQLIAGVLSLIGIKPGTTAPVNPRPMAAVSGITNQDDQSTARIERAIATLLQTDPKLADHLEKLASLASGNPTLFNQLIAMLEKF